MDKRKSTKILKFAKKYKAIQYLGGCCVSCGENNQFKLTFHHIDINDKEFEYGDYDDRRWTDLKDELNKCELLCQNCHREKHYNESKILKYGIERRTNKLIYLEYSGSKCVKCGYDKCPSSLTFHHRYPKEKSFNIGNLGKKVYSLVDINELIKKEIDKCDLLCANCHVVEHTDTVFYDKYKNEINEKAFSYREPQSKLDREVIISMYLSGKKQIDISNHFSTSKGTISDIIKKYKAEKKGLDPQSS